MVPGLCKSFYGWCRNGQRPIEPVVSAARYRPIQHLAPGARAARRAHPALQSTELSHGGHLQQAALQLFEVEVTVARLFTMLPIVFLAASVPGTVAHLGTSQAAWLIVFAGYGTEAQILAYSLVAHVTFMVLNSLIGLVFMPFAIKGLRDASGSTVHTDAPDPTAAPDSPTG